MINIKDMTKLIIEEAGRDDYLGKWAEFCRTTGYNRHQVYFWRKKLGLVLRASASARERVPRPSRRKGGDTRAAIRLLIDAAAKQTDAIHAQTAATQRQSEAIEHHNKLLVALAEQVDNSTQDGAGAALRTQGIIRALSDKIAAQIAPEALFGPYWEARYKALYDREQECLEPTWPESYPAFSMPDANPVDVDLGPREG